MCVARRRAAVTSRRLAHCAHAFLRQHGFSASWRATAPQPRAASRGLAMHQAAAGAAARSAAWGRARGDCNGAGTRRVASPLVPLTCAYRLAESNRRSIRYEERSCGTAGAGVVRSRFGRALPAARAAPAQWRG